MTSARSYRRGALQLFGWLFVIAWGLALIAFPWVKGQPAGIVPVLVGLALGALGLLFARSARVDARALFAIPTWHFLLATIGAAAALRVVAICYFPLQPMVDDAEFHKYALNLLAGRGYGAPGFRAWFPPGMSLTLAGWYAITAASPISGKVLQVLLGCVLVWQTWAFGRQVVSEPIGRVAAVLVALLPTLVFYTATLGYEILLALLFIVLCRLSASFANGKNPVGRQLALGAVIGWGALVQPICLLIPALAAAGWWLAGAQPLQASVRALGVALAMLVVVSPWTYRNFLVLNRIVPVSTNGGYTLYSANNPRATGLAMVGSSRVDLQACKLEYSIVSPK